MVAAVLPIAALIRRELVTSLRQSRYFILIAAGVAFAMTMALLEWPGEHAMPFEMAARSADIYFEIVTTLAIGAALIVPALSGSSIATEREEETFELLAMTFARPWQVLFAKIVNSASHFLLMVIALMPIAAATYFLIGLTTAVLVNSLETIAMAALLCAAAGVVCSAMFDRPTVAVGASFFMALLLLGFPYVLLCIVLELFDLVDFDLAFSLGAYFAPLCLFAEQTNTGVGTVLPYAQLVQYVLVVFLAIALVAVAHVLLGKKWGAAREGHDTAPRRSWRTRTTASVRLREFGDFGHPVYLRDKWFDYGRSWSMRLLMVGAPFILSLSACSLIAVLSYVQNDDLATNAVTGWNMLQAVLLSVLLVALTGNIFTKERERGNLDALRMTLAGETSIVHAKLDAVFHVMRVILASAMAGSIPLYFSTMMHRGYFPTHFICALVMLLECLLVIGVAALFSSLIARKTVSAIVLALAIAGMVFIGNVFIAAIIANSLRHGPADISLDWLLGASPIMSYVYVMNGNNLSSRYIGAFVAALVFSAVEFCVMWSMCHFAYVRRRAQDT